MPILSGTTTALVARFAGAAVTFHAAALQALLRKANFNPNQPRVPRGNPDGGQWTRVGDGAAPILVSDEGGPFGAPPEIPPSRPTDSATRNGVIRAVAGFARTLSRRAGPVGLFLDYVESTWLTTDLNEIDAYLDEPKTLAELQADVAYPKKGYHIHHIVEQTSAAEDGFPRSMIDGSDNLVRIPALIHREITNWYATRTEDYGWLSPRDYLRGKTWEERRALGLKKLIDFGVLLQ